MPSSVPPSLILAGPILPHASRAPSSRTWRSSAPPTAPRDFNASSTSSKISIKDLLRERLTASKFVWPRARRARVEARARGSTLGERGAEQAVKSTSHAARERKERERERGRRRERERRCSLERRGPPRASGLLRASAMVPVAAQSPRWRGTPSLSRAPRVWSAGSS